MTAAWRGLWSVALISVALTSCAPPPRPGELTSFAGRYRAERSRRAERFAVAEAELVVRLDGRATGRLPALLVTAAMAAPDRLRFRAGWMLGTALDAVAQGDSLRVWLPTEHALLEVSHLSDSLHRPAPVALLLNAMSASWDPPEAAWRSAIAESAVVRVGWREGEDSLSMVVDGMVHPLELRIERAGAVVRVGYSDWRRWSGVDWPTRMELADADGRFRMRTEIQSLRPAARIREDWFDLRAPSDAERMDWRQLRERLGAPREGTP